jgi:ketosteroid isomerase-like protein
MDREGVRRWVDGYERAWRTHGTQALEGLFDEDATYQMSPWSDRYVGIAAIAELWEAERDGPDEEFTMTSSVIAVEGSVAVVRAEVAYARGKTWRDLWVLEFDEGGRCRAFEEWPFAPERPHGH